MSTTELGLRERGKLRRRERILEAARELLRERPDQPLTIERIAERAEVAKATVFNLVGNRDDIWAALAGRAFEELDALTSGSVEDPHERARAIVDSIMRAVTADAAVFRALLVGWSQSGRVLSRDPAQDIVNCLRDAEQGGLIADGLNLNRLGELVAVGLNGAVHQWAAGVISDRTLRARARDTVDLAFAAARPPDRPPRWELRRRQP